MVPPKKKSSGSLSPVCPPRSAAGPGGIQRVPWGAGSITEDRGVLEWYPGAGGHWGHLVSPLDAGEIGVTQCLPWVLGDVRVTRCHRWVLGDVGVPIMSK